MAIDYEALGQRIKDARKQKGYTQEQLAAAVGMSQQHIGNIETAANKLSLQALLDIAEALDVTADALLYDSLPSAVNTYDIRAKQILDGCSDADKDSLLHLMAEMRDVLNNKNA